MNKIQKIFITITLFFVILALLVGLGIQGTSTANAASTNATDFTQFTEDEQNTLNNLIEREWETPHPNVLQELQQGATTITTSGNVWYYLTQDISVNFSSQIAISGHVRILLNGYSISGSLLLKPTNAYAAKVSIFDKIPDMSGTGYDYNPSPERYYSYNSSTGGYTTYSTSQPSGTDVTDLPTWQANTYIKVTGSAISPNSQNSTISMYIYAYAYSTINMYGVNVVGVVNRNTAILVAQGYATLILYQCNIIGNKSNSDQSAVSIYQDGTLSIKGCKIYGNQTTHTNPGIQVSNTVIPNKAADISILYRPNLTLEKSNIGALCGNINKTSSYSKAVWLKDVDFKQAITGCNMDNFEAKIQNMNNITGTIELVYSNNLTYNGNSPNLKFIVHGGNSNTVPKKGFNNLTIASSGNVGNITTVFDSPISKITVQGTVHGLSTPGEAEIAAGGTVTIQAEQSVATLLNNGTLNLVGTINSLTNTGQVNLSGTVNNLTSSGGTISILDNANIASTAITAITAGEVLLKTNTATLPNDLIVQEGVIFTIFEGVSTTSTITNKGIVNIAGSISTITNESTGVVSINSGAKIENITTQGEVKVNSGGVVDHITVNDGYTVVNENGTIQNAILNNGTLEITRHAAVNTVTQSDVSNLIDHRGTPKKPNSIIYFVVGGIIIVIILVILSIILLYKKKKHKNKQK